MTSLPPTYLPQVTRYNKKLNYSNQSSTIYLQLHALATQAKHQYTLPKSQPTDTNYFILSLPKLNQKQQQKKQQKQKPSSTISSHPTILLPTPPSTKPLTTTTTSTLVLLPPQTEPNVEANVSTHLDFNQIVDRLRKKQLSNLGTQGKATLPLKKDVIVPKEEDVSMSEEDRLKKERRRQLRKKLLKEPLKDLLKEWSKYSLLSNGTDILPVTSEPLVNTTQPALSLQKVGDSLSGRVHPTLDLPTTGQGIKPPTIDSSNLESRKATQYNHLISPTQTPLILQPPTFQEIHTTVVAPILYIQPSLDHEAMPTKTKYELSIAKKPTILQPLPLSQFSIPRQEKAVVEDVSSSSVRQEKDDISVTTHPKKPETETPSPVIVKPAPFKKTVQDTHSEQSTTQEEPILISTHQGKKKKDESTPLISVIVPMYDVEKYITGAIESLLTQTYPNLEILLIDDQSTDATHSLAAALSTRYPNIHVYKNEKNYGTNISINLGIMNASGEYITIMSVNERLVKTKLKSQVNFLEEHPLHMAILCNSTLLDETTGKVIETELGAHTIMFRKYVVDTIGYYDSTRYCTYEEYVERIQKVYGKEWVSHINKVLSVKKENSRTEKAYLNKARKWHETTIPLYMPFPLKKRPFPLR